MSSDVTCDGETSPDPGGLIKMSERDDVADGSSGGGGSDGEFSSNNSPAKSSSRPTELRKPVIGANFNAAPFHPAGCGDQPHYQEFSPGIKFPTPPYLVDDQNYCPETPDEPPHIQFLPPGAAMVQMVPDPAAMLPPGTVLHQANRVYDTNGFVQNYFVTPQPLLDSPMGEDGKYLPQPYRPVYQLDPQQPPFQPLFRPQHRLNPNVAPFDERRFRPRRQLTASAENTESVSPNSTEEAVEEGSTEVGQRDPLAIALSTLGSPKLDAIGCDKIEVTFTPPEVPEDLLGDPPEHEITYTILLYAAKTMQGYTEIYSGSKPVICLTELTPNTEYRFRFTCLYGEISGDTIESSCRTGFTVPEQPKPPKLSSRNKSSFSLKWVNPPDNGSKVIECLLEIRQAGADHYWQRCYLGNLKTHKVNRLNPDTQYFFRLRAVNALGPSAWSEEVSFHTSGLVPAKPDAPLLQEATANSLRLGWSRREGDQHFVLQLQDEVTQHGYMPIYRGDETFYLVYQLRSKAKFRFRLAAENESGQSVWSDETTCCTLADRPMQPRNLQLREKPSAHRFSLRWLPPSADGGDEGLQYEVELDGGDGCMIAYQGSLPEFRCEHVKPGTCYRVRVRCRNSVGASDWSKSLEVTTDAVAPAAPLPPQLQTTAGSTAAGSASSLHLCWEDSTWDGGSPIVRHEVTQVLADTCLVVYDGPARQTVVGSLQPGSAYTFRLRVFNAKGASPYSEDCTLTTAPGPPDTPDKINIMQRSHSTLQLTWATPASHGAPVTEYRLEGALPTGSQFQYLATLLPSQLHFTARDLSPATNYTFRLAAVNSAGSSSVSPPISADTMAAVPSQPVLSSIDVLSSDSVELQWQEPFSNGADILGYTILLNGVSFVSVKLARRSFVIAQLKPDTTYRFRVQAVNKMGYGVTSRELKCSTLCLPPSPPVLEAAVITHNSLKLKWSVTSSSAETTYTLYQHKSNRWVAVFQGAVLQHKVVKLQGETTYKFRITAKNSAGEGKPSDVLSITTSPSPPPQMTAPVVTAVSQSSVALSWKSQPAASAYYLQLSSPGEQFQQVYHGTDLSHSAVDLTAGVSYQARVCSCRQTAAGDIKGIWSAAVLFKTIPTESTVTTSAESGQSAAATSRTAASSSALSLARWRELEFSDQNWAIIILFGFTLLAIALAFVAQKLVVA